MKSEFLNAKSAYRQYILCHYRYIFIVLCKSDYVVIKTIFVKMSKQINWFVKIDSLWAENSSNTYTHAKTQNEANNSAMDNCHFNQPLFSSHDRIYIKNILDPPGCLFSLSLHKVCDTRILAFHTLAHNVHFFENSFFPICISLSLVLSVGETHCAFLIQC